MRIFATRLLLVVLTVTPLAPNQLSARAQGVWAQLPWQDVMRATASAALRAWPPCIGHGLGLSDRQSLDGTHIGAIGLMLSSCASSRASCGQLPIGFDNSAYSHGSLSPSMDR